MQQCPDSLPELLFLIWSRRQLLGRNWRPLPFSGALLLLFQRFTFSQSGGLINWAGPIRECFLLEQSQRIDYNGKSRWFYRPTICHALISNEALDLKSGCVNVLAFTLGTKLAQDIGLRGYAFDVQHNTEFSVPECIFEALVYLLYYLLAKATLQSTRPPEDVQMKNSGYILNVVNGQ